MTRDMQREEELTWGLSLCFLVLPIARIFALVTFCTCPQSLLYSCLPNCLHTHRFLPSPLSHLFSLVYTGSKLSEKGDNSPSFGVIIKTYTCNFLQSTQCSLHLNPMLSSLVIVAPLDLQISNSSLHYQFFNVYLIICIFCPNFLEFLSSKVGLDTKFTISRVEVCPCHQ